MSPTSPLMRTWLRVASVVIPVVVLIALLTVGLRGAGGPPVPGEPAPAFFGPVLGDEGRTVSLEDYRGRPVLLNFWASWCVPCEDEAPMLRRAHETFGDQIVFIGIDIRDARSDALAFAERLRLDYTHVRDEDLSIYDDYGLTGQPETFVIDADGVVFEHVQGPFLRQGDLFALLDSVIADG